MSPTLLETARAALFTALEASPLVRYLRASRANWASAWCRARALTADEIAGLEARGNRCATWAGVKVLGEGNLDAVHGCRFEGSILFCLEKDSPALCESRFRDSFIGAATVDDCPLISRAWIADGAFLRNVGELRGL